jgi:tetratricopeptide (TPR) repeat protein
VRALAKILAWQASCISQHEVRHDAVERCTALLADPAMSDPEARRDRPVVLAHLGVADVQIDIERSRAHFEECLALYRALGDRWGLATALNNMTFVAWVTGDYEEARQWGYESLAICRSLGAKRGTLWATGWLMTVALSRGEIEEFEQLRQENEVLSRAFGDRGSLGTVRLAQANGHLLRGRYAEADAAYESALEIYRELGAWIVYARVTSFQSLASMWGGAYEQALAQARRVLELATERGAGQLAICGHARLALGGVALARGALAEAEQFFRQSTAIYERVHVDDDRGQALGCLSLTARGLGQRAKARQYLAHALRIHLKVRGMVATAIALSASALLLCDAGEVAQAVEVYALATRHPFAAPSPWFEDVAGRTIAAAAEALPPEVVAAAEARGRARDLWAAVEELLAELEGAEGEPH